MKTACQGGKTEYAVLTRFFCGGSVRNKKAPEVNRGFSGTLAGTARTRCGVYIAHYPQAQAFLAAVMRGPANRSEKTGQVGCSNVPAGFRGRLRAVRLPGLPRISAKKLRTDGVR